MWQAVQLVVLLIAPLAIYAIIVHVLEQLVQRRLANRFGWRSLLWTAWLGTPIHELSHALMCVVFRHRIDELALFEPDAESGCLGFVRHSYHRGNWYQEVGNVFIAVAPLVGGTLVLAALLWLFYPETMQLVVSAEMATSGESVSWMGGAADSVRSTLGSLLTWEHFKTARLWLFLYLVICVGSHMAPSWSDYRGAAKGAIFLAVLLAIIALIVAVLGTQSHQVEAWVSSAWAPVIAILALALALCFVAAAGVYGLTSIFDLFFARNA